LNIECRLTIYDVGKYGHFSEMTDWLTRMIRDNQPYIFPDKPSTPVVSCV